MFRLLSVEKCIPSNSSGQNVRCTILADNILDDLPLTGKYVEGLSNNAQLTYGSVAITPDGHIAIMANNGKWGDWL